MWSRGWIAVFKIDEKRTFLLFKFLMGKAVELGLLRRRDEAPISVDVIGPQSSSSSTRLGGKQITSMP